ncbi:MAG: DUF4332 domain-containing protein [Pleurocapsa sp.]
MNPAYWSIDKLPGLKPSEQDLLKAHGITNTQQLLVKARNLQAQEHLAIQLKLKLNYVKKWAALADLARVPSVGCQYCGLLLHSGIISVSQLAVTPFHRLHRQILRLQVATLSRKDLAPAVKDVKQWVEEAKLLVN